jgi:hypothetical protein
MPEPSLAVLSDWSEFITAIAALIGAVGSVIAVIAVLKVKREVTTTNGKTLAALSDLAEGRRIRANVDAGDRTRSEERYVRELTEDEDNPHP